VLQFAVPFLALAAAALLTPAVSDLEVPPVGPAVPIEEPAEDPVEDQHNPVVHMALARLAYRYYRAQYSGGELGRYIGDFSGDKPPPGHDTVVAGAFEEDKPRKSPFGEAAPVMRHFWDLRLGDARGLAGFDSSVNRAQKYWTGGFGLGGAYDDQWSTNDGALRGTMGRGAVELHRRGEKGAAYWYLGHIAHLVQDLTVPAHAHLWPHPAKLDAYEHYVKDRYRERTTLPGGAVESFATPYELFRRTGEVSLRYDAGVGSGPLRGKDGTADRGRRRAGGFSADELKEEGDVLFALAVRRVAALFLLFYKTVDKAAPVVDLSVRPDGTLSAFAEDSESGVARTGYRFEWRRLAAPGWTPWAELAAGAPRARFTPQDAGLHGFRATAVDAAGNVGTSPVMTLRLPGAPLVSKR
jgi:hypothetical protein